MSSVLFEFMKLNLHVYLIELYVNCNDNCNPYNQKH